MASSNRHWPSMFKSKPHQWQHEPNSSLMSTGCHRSSFSSGCEERTPEPKPRWNPKPEQIRILEAIFDSGMVNPPRDEIRKIRAQLQEYGQVGDANVFYWFQNRKSRSKHKLRHLQNSKQRTTTTPPASNSSSSSSENNKSSPKSGVGGSGLTKSCTSNVFTLGPSTLSDVSNNNIPTFSLSPPPYFPVSQDEILTEPFTFPGHGFFLPEAVAAASGMVQFHGQPLTGPCGTVLMSELMSHGASKKVKINNSTTTTTTTPTSSIATTTSTSSAYTVAPTSTVSSPVTVPFLSSITQNHGGDAGAVHASGGAAVVEVRTTVFINDVAFELTAEPFSIRGTFGDDAVLVNAAGQPVLTDEWGVTLQPLQHGAFYYLI